MVYWSIIGLSLVAMLGCVVRSVYYAGSYSTEGRAILYAIGAVIFFICLFGWVVGGIVYKVDKSTCHVYANKTERPTKFVSYNLVTWDCLTKAHDGRWIPTSQIGDYNK
jgi:hypothetical protein